MGLWGDLDQTPLGDDPEETVARYFQGYGTDAQRLQGAELELLLVSVDRDSPTGFALLDRRTHDRLFAALEPTGNSHETPPLGDRRDVHVTPEPLCSQLEHISAAYSLDPVFVHHTANQIGAQNALIISAASEMTPKVQLLPFAVPAFFSSAECFEQTIRESVDPRSYERRISVMLDAFIQHTDPECWDYSYTNTAFHHTTGFATRRDAFEMAWIHMILASPNFIIGENRPPYQGGKEERVSIHTGIATRMALNKTGPRHDRKHGLCPEFMLAAANENEMFSGMARHYLDAPMVGYYDLSGIFCGTVRGQAVAPRTIEEMGLGPRIMAQVLTNASQDWTVTRIKPDFNVVKGPDESFVSAEIVGGRIEERDIDSGPGAADTFTLLNSMFAGSSEKRKEFFRLCAVKYGIPAFRNPKVSAEILQDNLSNALHRGNLHIHGSERHLDVPFGVKGHTVRDLVKDLLAMMEEYYRGTPAYEKLNRWRFLNETGRNDSELWHASFASMQEQREAVRAMLDDPAYPELWSSGETFAEQQDRISCLKPRALKGKKISSVMVPADVAPALQNS